MLPTDRKLVQWFPKNFATLVILVARTPLATERSLANKVHSDALDVRKQRRAFRERRGERDAFVAGADGDGSTEATGKRERDISVASAQIYVERWAGAAVSVEGRRVVLLLLITQEQGEREGNVPLLHGQSRHRCTGPKRLASTFLSRYGLSISQQ